MGKDQPLTFEVRDDELVVRIGVDTLAFCAHTPEGDGPLGLYESDPPYRVVDNLEFARDTIRFLTHEDEGGNTAFYQLLDEAAGKVVEGGSVAVEEMPRVTEDPE